MTIEDGYVGEDPLTIDHISLYDSNPMSNQQVANGPLVARYPYDTTDTLYSLVQNVERMWPKTISGYFQVELSENSIFSGAMVGGQDLSLGLYLFPTGYIGDVTSAPFNQTNSYPVQNLSTGVSGAMFFTYWQATGISEPSWGNSSMVLYLTNV